MRILARSAVLALLLATGCMPPAGAPPAAPGGAPPAAPGAMFTSEMVGKSGGARPRIDLLARGFVVGAEPVPAEYAYYLYLIFSDRQKDTAPARRAAAIAYLSLLNDVVVVARNTRVPRDRMAVLFAPMTGDAPARGALETMAPATFLDGYNYDRARSIAGIVRRATGRALPAVSIIGLQQPIESGQALTGELAIVDMTTDDEARAQHILTTLQDRLESGDDEISASSEPVVLRKLRDFFAFIGASTAALGTS